MPAKEETAVLTGEGQLAITRVVDAPIAVVFKAWTDPKRLARWWGPRGFTNPVCQFESHTGGALRIDMRGPDGTVYPMSGTVREFIKPRRLVLSCSALDDHGKPLLDVLTTVTFDEEDAHTRLTLRAKVLNCTPAGARHAEGMEAGWTQSLERLDAELARTAPKPTERGPAEGKSEQPAPADRSSQPPESAGAEMLDREIIQSRVFDAPRQLVWKAWTDPHQIVNWWGPLGFSTTTRRMEVRPGGVWRFVMHGPDGRDYQNRVTYLQVEEPKRLVYRHGGDQETEPVNFEVTVTFEPEAGDDNRTRLTMRMTFPSKAARDFVVRQYHAIEGGQQTLARLAKHLEQAQAGWPGANRMGLDRSGAGQRQAVGTSPTSAPERPFITTRVFPVRPEQMYNLWTQREHLLNWFGPKGCTLGSCTIDLRPGGTMHYRMCPQDGPDHWGKWVFREIVPSERLEFVVSFSDEAGGVARAPFNEDWPLETLSVVTFAPHAGIGGGTVVTVRWTPINANEKERQAFQEGYDLMRQGWSGTFDQLAEYIGKL